jgi:hypothetical protein
VSKWLNLVLTEDIKFQRPLTRAEYTTAARFIKLRTTSTREEEAPPDSSADTQFSTPEAFTPLSSPPARGHHHPLYRRVEANIKYQSPPVPILETNGGAGLRETKHPLRRPKKSNYWPSDAAPAANHSPSYSAFPAATPYANKHA